MKYLKQFANQSDYQTFKDSEDYVLPNVSYVVETNGVSYEPLKAFKLQAKYNATEENKLAIADTSNVKSLKVNGTEVEFGDTYYFNEVGEYDVEIELIDKTLINGIRFNEDGNVIASSMFCDVETWRGSCLTSLTIPDSVTSIGNNAFCSCSGLTSVHIGSGVTSIESNAFEICPGLVSIVVSSGNTVYDSRENCNCIIETATNTLIQGCNNSFIPDSVTSIGNNAFFGYEGLTGELVIPDSVKTIGNYAFSGCTGLTSIVIPDSVETIGEAAFNLCSRLTSIVISDSVTSIGNNAFYYCSGLTSITSYAVTNTVSTTNKNWFFHSFWKFKKTTETTNI